MEFLENPKRFIEIGARNPKGVLLWTSGHRQDVIAKAVAGEQASNPVISAPICGVVCGRRRFPGSRSFRPGQKVAPSMFS